MQKASLSVSYNNGRHSDFPPVGMHPLTPLPSGSATGWALGTVVFFDEGLVLLWKRSAYPDAKDWWSGFVDKLLTGRLVWDAGPLGRVVPCHGSSRYTCLILSGVMQRKLLSRCCFPTFLYQSRPSLRIDRTPAASILTGERYPHVYTWAIIGCGSLLFACDVSAMVV